MKSKTSKTRSTKTTLKFFNSNKLHKLSEFIDEYRNVVAQFVDIFWKQEKIFKLVSKSMREPINSWSQTSLYVPNFNQTYFVVVTIKNNQSAKLYLNSQSLFEVYYSNNTLGYSNNRLTFGKHSRQPFHFPGQLDEVAIYGKILTQNEINVLYEFKKGLFYEQILPIGIKELNILSCNLTSGNIYDVVILTDKNKLEQKVIVK